jgi:hypothetical protein
MTKLEMNQDEYERKLDMEDEIVSTIEPTAPEAATPVRATEREEATEPTAPFA